MGKVIVGGAEKAQLLDGSESRIARIMYVREEFVRKGWMLDF